jgi:hypothetical protein
MIYIAGCCDAHHALNVRSFLERRLSPMTRSRVLSSKGSVALVLGTFVTSLAFAGCGGDGSSGAPTPEEAPKRAKYMDLHPELTKPQKPVRVGPRTVR